MKDRALYSITGLRFLFALGIVFFHLAGTFGSIHSNVFGFIYTYGWYGNGFFFMTAGFLFALGYKERIQNEEIKFVPFIVKKYKRLFPAYFLSTVIHFLGLVLINKNTDITGSMIVNFLTMTMKGWFTDGIKIINAPTWFVCVLMWCFIVGYICFYIGRKDINIYYMVICLVLIWSWILCIRNIDFPFCFSSDGDGLLNFFLGIVLAEIYARKKIWSKAVVVYPIVSILILIYSLILGKGDLGVMIGNTVPVITVFLMVPIFFISVNDSLINKLFSIKPFMVLGGISYEICMWHCPFGKIWEVIREKTGFGGVSMDVQVIIFMVILIGWCYVFKTICEYLVHRLYKE